MLGPGSLMGIRVLDLLIGLRAGGTRGKGPFLSQFEAIVIAFWVEELGRCCVGVVGECRNLAVE